MLTLVSTARPSLHDSKSGLALDPECVFNILQNKCDGDAHYASAMKLLRCEVMLQSGKVVEPSAHSTNTAWATSTTHPHKQATPVLLLHATHLTNVCDGRSLCPSAE
jgi:hypothetical protein